ncbi:hypothetical protein TEA_028571 [Camellia sinensis var. sinensis]|uniref:Ribosomal RNA-processing protein 42 n=1 Tax=Camellia sinensis var. sinensis TaxID=542762 RepID=A0A4S4EVE9_CAMSN|nr:hypothetical protein TEA_028571 [Camellia sinensis var. sinensis]
MVGLSIGEQHFIQGGIAQDLRSDGRKRLTYRPISIETGVIPQANGSARVKLGATDVIASVKAELGKPSPFQPDKGKVSIYVDCSPTAAPVFELGMIKVLKSGCGRRNGGGGGDAVAVVGCKGRSVTVAIGALKVQLKTYATLEGIAQFLKSGCGRRNGGGDAVAVPGCKGRSVTVAGRGGDELSAELSTALQRCLLGGKSGTGAGIDLSSLSIVEGKICWDLYIDGLVVSSDGNLLDALGAAIKAALSNTGIPKVQVAASAPSDGQPEVDISDEEFLQFDTSGVPVIVTLTKVGRHYIVDATSEEESQMSSAISVSVNRQGRICGLTKRGGAGLDPSVILDMVSVTKHVSEQLMNKLDSEISAAEACEEES